MLLTSDGAADFLHCSRKHLYVLTQRGEIPAFRMGGRWRYRKESLERWARDQERTHSMSQVEA